MNENVSVFKHRFHPVCVRDEVGAQVAAVELHAFDDFKLGFKAIGLFDRDDAVHADFAHRLGENCSDLFVAIGADRTDGCDFRSVFGVAGQLGKGIKHGGDACVDTPLEVHWVGAGSDHLGAMAVNSLGEHSGGGCPVAGHIRSLGCDLFDHLSANVLELVGELDFFGDGDAVFGHNRCAEALLKDHVATFGAEGHLNGGGEDVDTFEHFGPCVFTKVDFFSGHDFSWVAR